jgi:hypothetical protein
VPPIGTPKRSDDTKDSPALSAVQAGVRGDISKIEKYHTTVRHHLNRGDIGPTTDERHRSRRSVRTRERARERRGVRERHACFFEFTAIFGSINRLNTRAALRRVRASEAQLSDKKRSLTASEAQLSDKERSLAVSEVQLSDKERSLAVSEVQQKRF